MSDLHEPAAAAIQKSMNNQRATGAPVALYKLFAPDVCAGPSFSLSLSLSFSCSTLVLHLYLLRKGI